MRIGNIFDQISRIFLKQISRIFLIKFHKYSLIKFQEYSSIKFQEYSSIKFQKCFSNKFQKCFRTFFLPRSRFALRGPSYLMPSSWKASFMRTWPSWGSNKILLTSSSSPDLLAFRLTGTLTKKWKGFVRLKTFLVQGLTEAMWCSVNFFQNIVGKFWADSIL